MTRRSLAKWVRGVVSAAVIITAVLTSAGTAFADDGYRSTTTYCGSFSSVAYPGGPAHAKVRYCKIVWSKNILDGSYWQTVSFQLLDSYTDGYCANALVDAYGTQNTFSECNGVWTTKTKTYSGRRGWIQVLVNYGSYPNWHGYTGGGLWNAPSGF
jgi:hypothetical protein